MLEPWHWMAFGMLLILAEIFLPSFTALWFGLGACLVALISMLMPELDFRIQILIWTLISSITTFMWFKYFRKTMKDRTKAGITKEAIRGEVGYVIKAPTAGRHGLARFTPALLGDDEWPFIVLTSDLNLDNQEQLQSAVHSPPLNPTIEIEVKEGDKIIVQAITGNTLIVSKK